MHITIDVNEAISELMRYNDTELPAALICPTWLLAMQLEYGQRAVATGRIRKMVERHLIAEARKIDVTPGYDPELVRIERRFQADVERVKKHLQYDPDTKRVEYYYPRNRQFYYAPYMIAGLLYEQGFVWVTELHVEEAIFQLSGKRLNTYENRFVSKARAIV